MAKAEKSIEIEVSREKLLSVITDFARYPEFIPDMQKSEILSHDGDVWVVKYTISIIKTIIYTLKLVATPPTGLTWTLVDSNLMTLNSGGWRLDDLGENRCRANYFIEIQLGRFVPKVITTKLAEVSLPKTLQQFKSRAESLFR
ncbi:MAG: SRPBCC family protein [Myxococcales bacterium]|nr:SRPBCC family protein [Myxococcales bacterium]